MKHEVVGSAGSDLLLLLCFFQCAQVYTIIYIDRSKYIQSFRQPDLDLEGKHGNWLLYFGIYFRNCDNETQKEEKKRENTRRRVTEEGTDRKVKRFTGEGENWATEM